MNKLHCFIVIIFLFLFATNGCAKPPSVMNENGNEAKSEEEIMEDQLFDRFQGSNGTQIDKVFEKFIQGIKHKDVVTLKNMFSKNVVKQSNNIDQQLLEIIEMVRGDVISYQRYGPGTYTYKSGDTYRKEIEASFNLETTVGFYKIALRMCIVDTADDNVGICSVCVIETEKDDSSVYWGDGDGELGIIIEK